MKTYCIKIFVLFVLLIFKLDVFSQADFKITPFSDWKDKRLPLQDWVTINGDTLKQSTFEKKVCFFNFFSNGCPPCMQEVRYLNNLLKHYSEVKDVIIVAFYSGTKESYEKYVKASSDETKASSSSRLNLKYSMTPIPKYLIIPLDPSMFKYKYNAWGVPSNLILDKDGIVRFCSIGFAMERSVQENLYSEYISNIDKLRQ